MKQTVQIRPEQARMLKAKQAVAETAANAYQAAMDVALAGLLNGYVGQVRVRSVTDEGVVTLDVDDVPAVPDVPVAEEG